jgi:hypothetical protein
MNFVMILKVIAALATVAVGVLGLVQPTAVFGLTGLMAAGKRGISEIRASFGGLFIGLGLAPLWLGPVAYQMLGIGYLALAAARLFAIFYDRTMERTNWINLAVEVVFGLILAVF